jgi:RHS repeat-associated protein
VKVRSAQTTTLTIQTAEFDGSGRRIKKVVSNSGSLDATWVYFYDGQKIIETRDGSGNMVQQFIHGTRYIDELIQMRVKDKGDLYVHQDANWNVTGLTDLGGSIVERYVYTPYGELTVHQDTGYGDRDGDQDVDSTDKGTVGTTCTGTVTGACRILDLDFDGDYDSTDATKFDALPQGLARHPGKTSTGVDQPFVHQGLLYEPEVASYQNRERQLDPAKRRFLQSDPRGYADNLNLFAYARNNPGRFTDPKGTLASMIESDLPDQVRITVNVVFWGAGIYLQTPFSKRPLPFYESDYPDAEFNQVWNQPANIGLGVSNGSECKPVKFVFRTEYLVLPFYGKWP